MAHSQQILESQAQLRQVIDLRQQLLTIKLQNLMLNQDLAYSLDDYPEEAPSNSVTYARSQSGSHGYTAGRLQPTRYTVQEEDTAECSEAIADLTRQLQAKQLRDILLANHLPPPEEVTPRPETITSPSSHLHFHNTPADRHFQAPSLHAISRSGLNNAQSTSTTNFSDSRNLYESTTLLGSLSVKPAASTPPLIPQEPLYRIVPLPPRTPEVSKPSYHTYGDCAETLPLATMTNIWNLPGPAEVRSVAVFANKIRVWPSIADATTPIRLRDPCLNCKSLMLRLPPSVAVIAGTGYSGDICWTVGNHSKYFSDVGSVPQPPMSDECFSMPVFSLSIAYSANLEQIYGILKHYTLQSRSPLLSEDLRSSLVEVWCSMIAPYRDYGLMFRVNVYDQIQPLIVTINGVKTPLCTVFCAVAFILSTVLHPTTVESQRNISFVHILAVLAKWCYTLCPWGHPNVVTVSYTSRRTPDVDMCFLLGTSKPSLKPDAGPHSMNAKHKSQMRAIRRVLLEGHFGRLPEPCPERVAAGY